MRRLSGVVLAGAILILPAFSQSVTAQEAAPAAAQPAAQQAATEKPAEPAAPKTTYEGDTAIILYATNPGKDADYEQVIATVRAALAKSTDPQAKEQLASWHVTKLTKSLDQGGGSTYVHIINPVVKGADYSIVNIVYAASNYDEKLAFFNLYKGALKGALSLWTGTTVK